MKYIFTFSLIIILTAQTTFSQEWLYTQHIQPFVNAGIRGLTLDQDSNLYVTAFHRSNAGTTNFIGPYGTIPLAITGAQDMIIAKLSPEGDTLWTKDLGGTGSDYPRQVAIDNNNDPYLTGVFRSPSMTIQSTTLTNTTPTSYDIFLAKYTADGANGFARKVAWGQDDQEVSQIAIDNSGNIYMVGSYTDSICFATDTLVTAPAGGAYLFLAKFKPNGDLRWAKNIQSTGGSSATTNFSEISIANDEEIYIGGYFLNTLTVDGISVTSQGTAEDMLIMKVDSSGATQWMRMGGSNNLADRCNGITTSSTGDIYITGYFQGSALFDSTGRGLLNSSAFSSAGGTDMFMAKYSPSGRLLWKRKNGSTGADIAYGAKIRENILQFTGSFSGSLTFNNTTISSGSTTNADAGFFVYDTDGNPITAQSVQGTLEDRGEYIEYGLKGNTYIGGYFKSASLTIGSTTLNKQAARAATSSDAFVAKYHNPFSATFSTQTNVNCPGGNTGVLQVTSYFGTAPYVYNWSASTGTGTYNDSLATNLTAGFYSVTITDARDSSVTATYTITDPADFNVVLDSTNLTCNNSNDGIILTTASGGTGALTYTWSGPGVSNPTNEDQLDLTPGKYKVVVKDTRNCTASDSTTITEPAPVYFGDVVVVREDPAGSSNGSINLDVSGGTQPYTYSWYNETVLMPGRVNDTLNNLQEGFYTAHVTDDNLCEADTNIIVPGENLRVLLTPTNITCYKANNGIAVATIVSGDKGHPYTYAFENSVHNPVTPINDSTIASLTPGWYYVTIEEQGGDNRTASDSVQITQPDSIDLTLTPVNLLCNKVNTGSIGLSVAGGTPSYSYAWSNGATTQSISSLLAGNYSVTVRDAHNCTAFESAVVTQPDTLIVAITLSHIVSCNGGSNGQLQANATGGTPGYGYLWNDAGVQTTSLATGLTARSYTVAINDAHGCLANASYILTQPTPLAFVDIDTTDVTCKGGSDGSISVTLTGGTLPYSYEWNHGYPDTNRLENLPSRLTPYTLTVRDANNCINDSLSYLLKEPASALVVTISDTIHNPCFGNALGIIDIGGFGGWGTYEFSIDSILWNTNGIFNNLDAAIYTTHARDYRGCVVERLIQIRQPDTLVGNIVLAKPVSCFSDADGAITVNVTGGTTPYLYLWDDGLVQTNDTASNLIAGNYSVLITDAHSCTNTAGFLLVQPLPLVISSIDTADISCFGETDGRIAIYMEGGTSPYTYQWTNSQPDTNVIENLAALALPYALRVLDANACENDSFAYTIKGPDSDLLIEEVTASHIDNLCFSDASGSFSVLASGGWGNYEYSINLIDWQITSAFNNLIALTYTVTVSDNEGCLKDIPVTIAEPSQIIVNTVVSGRNITVNATGGVQPYSYSLNSGTWQTSPEFLDLAAGTYYVDVTDANDCGPVRSVNIIIPPNGVLETENIITSIYPNPSKGIVNLDYTISAGSLIKLQVYSMTGSMVYDETFIAAEGISNTLQIDLSDATQGVYMLKMNGILLNTKLVIE